MESRIPGSSGRQTRLLLRKNYILKKRLWRATCCEILIPLLPILLVLLFRAAVKVKDVEQHLPIEDAVTVCLFPAPHEGPHCDGCLSS